MKYLRSQLVLLPVLLEAKLWGSGLVPQVTTLYLPRGDAYRQFHVFSGWVTSCGRERRYSLLGRGGPLCSNGRTFVVIH